MFNYGNANEAQKEAISATDGLVLITAGPGTGKTFTLVKRAVYLIQECGIKPEQIMMATFTEKAAKELITRITNELAERNISVNVNEMYIGTFHSLCLRIIKENLEFTRLKRNYRLLDTFDQKYLVFRNFHRFKNIEGIDELLSKGGSWKRSDEICTYINHLSEEMVDIEALQSDDNPGIRTLGRVLSVYQEMLEEGNLIDFSTIQTECYKLLMQNKQILEENNGICMGRDGEKIIYLTFDSGYEAGYMDKILTTLKENNVKATFFITAHYLNSATEEVEKMVNDGHIIGNHTVNHKSMPSINNETIEKEIMQLHQSMYEKFGYEMKYLRPPKGEFNERTLQKTSSLGYKTVMWSFAYCDWDEKKQPSQEEAIKIITKNFHSGEIMLLHSNSKTNSEVLDKIIKEAKNQGYEFKSLDEFKN